MRRIAAVLLIDDRGWLLLQERDEHAPRFPNVWGMVGGHVDDGEDFEPAAYRELTEETGLTLPPATLQLWRVEEVVVSEGAHDPGVEETIHLYTARVSLADADITVGEGRQIIFVDPSRLAELDMPHHARALVETFIGSEHYQSLSSQAPIRSSQARSRSALVAYTELPSR